MMLIYCIAEPSNQCFNTLPKEGTLEDSVHIWAQL